MNPFLKIADSVWFINDDVEGNRRYVRLKRIIALSVVTVSLVPMIIMAGINFHQYNSSLRNEIIKPLHDLTNKAARSFDRFFKERSSAISFISAMYSFEELSNPKLFNKLFMVLKSKFREHVDMGLINENGVMVNYTGPYDLINKDYSRQNWFPKVVYKGVFISDVFMGYRNLPHVAIAVLHIKDDGKTWIIRSTMDTDIFDEIIYNMGIDQQADAFLINKKGILQTSSRLYGKVLSRCGINIPQTRTGTHVEELTDFAGRKLMVAYTHLINSDCTLVVIKSKSIVLKTWFVLKTDMLVVFFVGICAIIVIVMGLTEKLVKRLKVSDKKRLLAVKELEHNQKLSSVGRLATGVAHEINNPLAVINQNAGLIMDMIEYNKFDREIFKEKINVINFSVERAKKITHRLLGFAKRIEVKFEVLRINEIVTEVLIFLDKEALYKNIEISLSLSDELPLISSDRGQLEQVFLNILINAFDAIGNNGHIYISTSIADESMVRVSIEDNGNGISKENLPHIFEPFFTTSTAKGTGLGLSITYGIIKKLGGDIKVNSTLGKGTCFEVNLPYEKLGEKDEKFKNSFG